MNSAVPQSPIPYAQRRAEEISATSISEIREQFQLHRQTCTACAAPSGGLCPAGMALAARIEEARRPQISADAQFVASKIVKHMWIIFVLLPVVLAVLFALLK
jgi:hypothetical protein